MKEQNLTREMLSAENGQMSSKRVMGVMIIVSVLAVYLYCAFTGKDCPSITGELLLTATALLSVDPVTKMFNKKNEDA